MAPNKTATLEQAESKSLETQLEELDEEIREVARQLSEANGQIRRAEARFEELEARRSELATGAFRGDEAATKELETLEDEHDRIARSARLARSAAPQFEAELLELRGQRAEVQEQIYRAEFDRLSRELESLDAEMTPIAGELKTIIEKRQSLLHEMSRVAYKYDMPLSQSVVDDAAREGKNSLRRFFPTAWLSRRRREEPKPEAS